MSNKVANWVLVILALAYAFLVALLALSYAMV